MRLLAMDKLPHMRSLEEKEEEENTWVRIQSRATALAEVRRQSVRQRRARPLLLLVAKVVRSQEQKLYSPEGQWQVGGVKELERIQDEEQVQFSRQQRSTLWGGEGRRAKKQDAEAIHRTWVMRRKKGL